MQETPKLNEALAKAQAELSGAAKDKQNPHFRSKYADLASVWEAWKAVGPKNGLAITQSTRVLDGGMVVLVTALRHSSGEVIEGEFPVAPKVPDMQGFGSALTYARRYSLAALVGVAPEDDDGEAAVGRGSAPVAQSQPAVEKWTEKDSAGYPVTKTVTRPAPVAAPRAVSRPVPGKQQFVGAVESAAKQVTALAEPPGLMDVPAISDNDIPF